jgi:imidazolonepropionase-like amidohydrolase
MIKVCVFLAFLFIVAGQAFSQPCDYCVHNVTIVAPEQAQPLIKNKDVFIRGDKIVRIAASKSKPQAKTVIEGTGKFLMPGLADMHVHLPAEHIEKFLDLNLLGGVTTIRSMRGKMPHIELKRRIASGELLGPDLYISTPYFPNKNIKIGQLRDSIKAYKDAGFDFVKVLAVPDSAYYEALMEAAKAADISVVGHWPWQVAIDRVVETDYRCIEHLQGVFEAYRNDPNSIEGLVAKMKAHNTWNCPSLDYYNIFFDQVPLDVLQRRAGLEFIDSGEMADWTTRVREGFRTLNAGPADSVLLKKEKSRKYMEDKFRLVKRLYDLGAPLLVSSANDNDPFGVPGFSMWEEMKLYAAAGIPNKDILKMASYNAAKFFQEEKKWGSVAEGKRANLVLLSKNPVESLSNLEAREGTFITGHYYSRAELERLVKRG